MVKLETNVRECKRYDYGILRLDGYALTVNVFGSEEEINRATHAIHKAFAVFLEKELKIDNPPKK